MFTEKKFLNVGICSCTELYHGYMEGHEIVVPELTGYRYFGWHYFMPLETPLVFHLREVRIPERHERETLEKMECHFFVDVHAILRLVSLHIIHPIPENPAGSDKFYISELDRSTEEWQGDGNVWLSPTTQDVVDGMHQLIRRMDAKGLCQWLELVACHAKASAA